MNSEKDRAEQPGLDGAASRKLGSVSPGFSVERRASPRFKCLGSAQVRRKDGNFYTWGAITDISLEGCRLEMPTVFPSGTPVSLQVELASFRLILEGEVRSSSQSRGMGVVFRELTAVDREELDEIVRIIQSQEATPNDAVQLEDQPAGLPMVHDPVRALQVLRDFFKTRNVLTRNEFAEILHALVKPSEDVGASSEAISNGQKQDALKAKARGSGA